MGAEGLQVHKVLPSLLQNFNEFFTSHLGGPSRLCRLFRRTTTTL